MKSQIVFLAITFLILAGGCHSPQNSPTATTNFSAKDARAGSTAAKEVRLNPLEPKERTNWHIERGDWKFDSDALTGSGNSSIQYFRTISAPFQLKFDVHVVEGMRPRVQFDRFTFANEGYSHTFGLYPQQANSKRFPYELGETYSVQIDATARKIEVRVDGRLIDSRDVGVERIWQLRFSGGDDWSKGRTHFSNISIVYKE